MTRKEEEAYPGQPEACRTADRILHRTYRTRIRKGGSVVEALEAVKEMGAWLLNNTDVDIWGRLVLKKQKPKNK